MKRHLVAWCIVGASCLLEASFAVAQSNRSSPSGPAVSKYGMVATSEPLAVEVGLEVLKNGGNAIDAAVAAGAMIGLTEPMSCGIGGDLFAIVWDSKTQKLFGLNASGRSPQRANRDLFHQRGLQEIPTYGPLSWSVPGCVDGWCELLDRFGTRSLSDLLQPAIRTAEDGFAVSPIIARSWQQSTDLLGQWPNSARTYLPSGTAPREGERFRNPDLAESYRLVARGGRAEFYRGSLARQLVEASEAVGGLFDLSDLANHTSTWVEPVSATFRGLTVWELPPNCQGIAAIQMLNILEPYDLASMGHNSAEYLHHLIEAKKLAFEDRARYYADPAFEKIPLGALISKDYAAQRRQFIDKGRALQEIALEDPRLSGGETIYMTVVDKDRNAISYIQSNYHGFGSGVVPGRLGFVLQNRGNLFALDESHPNRLEPGKRPFHTIIPGFVTKDGKPWLSFGVMGGDMQPQGHVQVLLNMIEFGMDPQRAGAAPRFCHFGSSTPTGKHMADGGEVGLERGVDERARGGLRAKGHRLLPGGGAFGGYQAIRIDGDSGNLVGGSDPRKDGFALGY